jgi:hypothetical protein
LKSSALPTDRYNTGSLYFGARDII